MKVILEHDEILDAIAEYAAKRLNEDVKNITIRLNARKGRSFDADVEVVEYTNNNELPVANISNMPLIDNTIEEDHH